MKASHIKPGMVIDGWTVTGWWIGSREEEYENRDGEVSYIEREVVLLELERPPEIRPAPIRWADKVRTWYRADEEVECE